MIIRKKHIKNHWLETKVYVLSYKYNGHQQFNVAAKKWISYYEALLIKANKS